MKKPPLGDTYFSMRWSVLTNPVGHPTRQGLLFQIPYFKELMEVRISPKSSDVARVLARDDLFKKQRDFLKEQATRRDRLASLQGCGGGRPA